MKIRFGLLSLLIAVFLVAGSALAAGGTVDLKKLDYTGSAAKGGKVTIKFTLKKIPNGKECTLTIKGGVRGGSATEDAVTRTIFKDTFDQNGTYNITAQDVDSVDITDEDINDETAVLDVQAKLVCPKAKGKGKTTDNSEPLATLVNCSTTDALAPGKFLKGVALAAELD